MNKLFKKCLVVSSVITIPFVFGPVGIIMTMLIGSAGIDMFHNNLLMQIVVVLAIIASLVVPVLFVALMIYVVVRFFQSLVGEPAPQPVPSQALVVQQSAPKFFDDGVIEGEWEPVD